MNRDAQVSQARLPFPAAAALALCRPSFPAVSHANSYLVSASVHVVTRPSPMLVILYISPLPPYWASTPTRQILPLLRAGPSTGDVDPLGHTATLLAFYVDNIGIAATPAAHAVLLWRVPVLPVVVLLESLALVQRRFLKEGLPGQLSPERRVGRAVLDGRVSVSKVTEVMDIARGEQSTGGEGVDGRITPLRQRSVSRDWRARNKRRVGIARFEDLHAPSRIHRCGPSFRRSPHTPCS